MLDKLLNRDLDARRTDLRRERTDLVARLDDLERRRSRLEGYGLGQLRDIEQLASGGVAGEQELQSRLAAVEQDHAAEVEAMHDEIARLKRDGARIEEGFEAIEATQTRRIVRLAQVGLAAELITAALGLIPYGRGSTKAAHAIHLEY